MASKILHIDSSARGEQSESKQLTSDFIRRWSLINPEDIIIQRDIVDDPLPHIDSFTLQSILTPEEERTPEQRKAVGKSDELIDEFLEADVLVLGVPMYNFTIPSTLKAWIDYITMPGRTFEYTAEGPKGLVSNKQVYILSTRGGVYGDGPMDHQTNYLKVLFSFLGIQDIHIIQAEGLNISPESRDLGIAAAHAQIKDTLRAAAA